MSESSNDSKVGIRFPVITSEDFPHGVMCPACLRVILPGQPYQKMPLGMMDGVLMLRLQCVYCS